MMELLLIIFLPLIGFLLNGIFGKYFSDKTVGITGCLAVFLSFLVTVFAFGTFLANGSIPYQATAFNWIPAGNTIISFSFLADELSFIMMLVITGVGSLIHLYSIGYMKGDEGYGRYFSYLNLFVFFMLLLVMADNYLVMFVGWEGVGFCSYLLIGFWFRNNEYNKAANKAFVMNRIGDLGFLLGLFLIFTTFGSFSYTSIFEQAHSYSISSPVIIAITLLLFIGATGKSAQIPLYTWLPDAMAGPTPVSALIHAATMVTAGIYLIVRSNILYVLAPETLMVVAIIGIATALTGATIAVFQNDIKKVLAYSTVSQLGLIFLALGAGAFSSGIFHLVTHAFFKALLFLGAGSVIHAMGGEQDIRKMGGLKKHLPVTFLTFFAGCIAISGIPPFSGFFSKDEILANVFTYNKVLWALGVIVSLLTAFYMFRLLFLTFFNTFRGTEKQQHHLHESPTTMTLPLIILAILSVIGGVIGLPELFGFHHLLNNFLAPVLEASNQISGHIHLSHSTEIILMTVTVIAAVIAILTARYLYITKKQVPEVSPSAALPKLIFNKYYVDELYLTIIIKPLTQFSNFIFRFIEVNIIDAFVNGFGKGALQAGNVIKNIQTGNTGFYLFGMVIGVTAILLLNYIIQLLS